MNCKPHAIELYRALRGILRAKMNDPKLPALIVSASRLLEKVEGKRAALTVERERKNVAQ